MNSSFSAEPAMLLLKVSKSPNLSKKRQGRRSQSQLSQLTWNGR
ncbi:MAG: hypothetical protein V3S30_01880 [Thermoanaerobaculia bacterium]